MNDIASNPYRFQREEQLAEYLRGRDSDTESIEGTELAKLGRETLSLTLGLLKKASNTGLVYVDRRGTRTVPAERFLYLTSDIEVGKPYQPAANDPEAANDAEAANDPEATIEDPPPDSPMTNSQGDGPDPAGPEDEAESQGSDENDGGGDAAMEEQLPDPAGPEGEAEAQGGDGNGGGGEAAMEPDVPAPEEPEGDAAMQDGGPEQADAAGGAAAQSGDGDGAGGENEVEPETREEDSTDQLESIHGRGVTVVQRREQRWLLVKWFGKPLSAVEWIPEADFYTARRKRMLYAYKGRTGHPDNFDRDPEGRGWVRHVVRVLKRSARNKRAIYTVRWFVDTAGIPKKRTEQKVHRSWLVSPELALGIYDQGVDPPHPDDSDDSELSSDSDDGDAQSNFPLVWDASEGRSKVGISAALESFDVEHSWIEMALEEWCDWRLWLLQCRAPGEASETEDAIKNLGRDLYEIDRAKLDPYIPDGIGQDEHEKEQIDMIIDRVLRSWRRRRRQRERDTRRLKGQLLALNMLAARRQPDARPGIPSASQTSQSDDRARETLGFLNENESDAVLAIATDILKDKDDGNPWWRAFAQPRARMHTQTNLISGSRDAGGNRNAKQKRYLDWIRKTYSDKEKEFTVSTRRNTTVYKPEWINGDFGSPYSTFWPRRVTASNVSLEHIVPSVWLQISESRVLEAGLPRQDATICTVANNFENLARLDKPLGIFGDARDTTNTNLYHPTQVSKPKQTRLAAATCHGMLCYPFIAEESKQAGSRKISGTFGVSEYARRFEGLKRAAMKPASDVAKRIALVNAARHGWHNALTLRPGLLRQPRFSALLDMRLRGGRPRPEDPEQQRLDCGLAMLTDFVLAKSVEDAPK